ncbi:MAG: hypothetical protein R3Y50_04485 [Rikenellaceae bacterium]
MNEQPKTATTVKATANSSSKASVGAKKDKNVSQKQEKSEKEGGSWVSEAAGGVIGGAIVYGSDRVFSSDGEKAGKVNDEDYETNNLLSKDGGDDDEDVYVVVVVVVDDLVEELEPIVDDSMSFSEAFSSARSEYGAGAIFEWRGKVYGTYYKEEWDEMSSQEQNEFSNSVFSDDNSTDTDFGDDGYDDDFMVDVDDDFSVI